MVHWCRWHLSRTPPPPLLDHLGTPGGRRSRDFLGFRGKTPLHLKTTVEEKNFLEKGWWRTSQKPLPTFTTAQPSSKPLRRPAGLRDCSEQEVQRWKDHSHRFAPYQYMDQHCLQDAQGSLRTPNIREREAIMGFPPNYTLQCMKKEYHGTVSPWRLQTQLGGQPVGGGSCGVAATAATGALRGNISYLLVGHHDRAHPRKITSSANFAFAATVRTGQQDFLSQWSSGSKACWIGLHRGRRSDVAERVRSSGEAPPTQDGHSRTVVEMETSLRMEVERWRGTHQRARSSTSAYYVEVASVAAQTTQHQMRPPSGQPGSAPRFDQGKIIFKENEAYHHADQLLHTC